MRNNNNCAVVDQSRGVSARLPSGNNSLSNASIPYLGKCQYKTGKCFNERTLKRNGDAHSLCEEHRIKQNLIQRRSDRKYQTVHAIRRRERSQRRAILKKQVSMAVAQQLFFEHQKQKSMGITSALPFGNALQTPMLNQQLPILQIPSKLGDTSTGFSPFGLVSPILSFGFPTPQGPNQRNGSLIETPKNDERIHVIPEHSTESHQNQSPKNKKEEKTPTGIDDFTPDSFLTLQIPQDSEISSGITPIVTCTRGKDTWTVEDMEFLQNLL